MRSLTPILLLIATTATAQRSPRPTPPPQSPVARLRHFIQAHADPVSPVTPIRRQPLIAGTAVEQDVSLEPGRCYRIFATNDGRMGPAINLALLARRGRRSRVLQEASAVAVILGVDAPICPEQRVEHRVRFRSERDGVIAWQVMALAPRTETQTGPDLHRVGGTGGGYLPNGMRRRHSEVGEGAVAVSEMHTGSLRRSETATHTQRVEAGRCYRVIAVGMATARRLSLQVKDQYDTEKASAAAERTPHANFCVAVAGEVTIHVRMELGYGGYGVQVFAD